MTGEVRNKRPPKDTKRAQSWWSSFVQVDLTEAQKEMCKHWVAWDNDPDGAVQAVLGDGLKVTVKEDERSGGYLAMIVPATEPHKFAGWILTGRGSTALKAVKQACFRHLVQFEGDWPLITKEFGPDSFDD